MHTNEHAISMVVALMTKRIQMGQPAFFDRKTVQKALGLSSRSFVGRVLR